MAPALARRRGFFVDRPDTLGIGECTSTVDARASARDLARRASPRHGGDMHGFKGERTLMRIHIGERDRFEGKPLYQAIIDLLRDRHFAGATMFRGIAGFGASAKLHLDRIEILSIDLPIIIECVETEEHIEAILPELDRMIGGGLITLERAKVIMYRPGLNSDERPPEAAIDITGSWQRVEPERG
jgi:PII-like signaling protein